MEQLIRDALDKRDIRYLEGNRNVAGLDFHLVDYDVYIEVKQFYSERVAEQMSRAENVIVAQGRTAVAMLANLIAEAPR